MFSRALGDFLGEFESFSRLLETLLRQPGKMFGCFSARLRFFDLDDELPFLFGNGLACLGGPALFHRLFHITVFRFR